MTEATRKGEGLPFRSLGLLLWMLLLWPFSRLLPRRRSRWLVGENRGWPTGDNGYWFTRYCHETRPGQTVRLVIDRQSPWYDRGTREGLPVIAYGGPRHAWAYLRATTAFYTHLPSDLICLRCFDLFGFRGKLVYLHHGVLGFKAFDSLYRHYLGVMDLFTVAAPFEREILIDQERFPRQRIAMTGYPRHDRLKLSSAVSRKILYMPTHRSTYDGAESEGQLRAHTERLLRSPRLHRLLESHDVHLVALPHPYLKSLVTLSTSNPHIRIVPPGTTELNRLMEESALLITDYSSVAWDFLQRGRPVVFYRFDLDGYRRDRSSYLDLDDETLGPVAHNQNVLLNWVEYYLERNLVSDRALDERYRFANLDEPAAPRIFQLAKRLEEQDDTAEPT